MRVRCSQAFSLLSQILPYLVTNRLMPLFWHESVYHTWLTGESNASSSASSALTPWSFRSSTFNLQLDPDQVFPENWLYIHVERQSQSDLYSLWVVRETCTADIEWSGNYQPVWTLYLLFFQAWCHRCESENLAELCKESDPQTHVMNDFFKTNA